MFLAESSLAKTFSAESLDIEGKLNEFFIISTLSQNYSLINIQNHKLKILDNFLNESPESIEQCFITLNDTIAIRSKDKSLYYNIASTLMRCYLLNIFIDLAYESIDSDLDLLNYDANDVIDLLQALVNENHLNIDILNKYFKNTKFDLYHIFNEIEIKDKNFKFGEFDKKINEDPDQISNCFYSILSNNKLITFINKDEINSKTEIKPFPIISFNEEILKIMNNFLNYIESFTNEYFKNNYDFLFNLNVNVYLDENSILEINKFLEKSQKFIDENFNISSKKYDKIKVPNFFINEQHYKNEILNNYMKKEEEINKLIEEQNSYGKLEKKSKNYCKRCFKDIHKIITLSCDHEICEECIRNYISMKTFNLILIKYNCIGMLTCIKCPYDDCSIIMKKSEIFKPFTIYLNQIQENFKLVK